MPLRLQLPRLLSGKLLGRAPHDDTAHHALAHRSSEIKCIFLAPILPSGIGNTPISGYIYIQHIDVLKAKPPIEGVTNRGRLKESRQT